MRIPCTDFGQIWLFIFPLLSQITGKSDQSRYSPLSDATYKIFDSPINGTAAAFGDFNSDQHTDIFFIVNYGHGVWIHLTHQDGTQRSKHADITRMNDCITSVVPGDYDGDSQMDVLITTKPTDKALDKTVPTSVYVYWGTSLDTRNITLVTAKMYDQPLVLDYNADMIPDLFGAEMDNKRYFWTYNTSTTPASFTKVALTGEHSTDKLSIPNSHAFVDMDNDLAADIFVSSEGPQFEVWTKPEGVDQSWQFERMARLPVGDWAHIGLSSFADIDADGVMDHILPLCSDPKCKNSQVWAESSREGRWISLLNSKDLVFNNKQWGFVPPYQKLSNTVDIPLKLRTGDVNLDNYPDAVCILQQDENGTRAVVVLQNSGGNSFVPAWPSDDANHIKGPVLASLIDLTNSGLLDILVVSQASPHSSPQSHLLENKFSIDAYFVTVQVLSGFECNAPDCPNGRYTYGVNQPGIQIRYDTTSSNGGSQKSVAVQLSQSSYLSLQLPHVVMGLGQNPNFVDNLSVGLPSGKTERKRTFTAIIPNSHLIVIPRPLNQPEDWTSKLLITPGRSVLLTGIVLVGTCVFIAIIGALLHYKEKREDEIEKRQEAHRFHFDAM